MSAKRSRIDIPLDGVGQAPTRHQASIDIPLDSRTPTPSPQTAGLGDPQLEQMVNRHHAEIKELHRRARQGG